MKIAILNESFLTAHHIKRLQALGEVTQHSDTDNEALAIARLQDVDVAVTDCWLTPLNDAVLSHVPHLQYICLNSTGYDLVDLAAAKRHGVAIANVPGFSTDSVAEHAIALMFATIRHIGQADRAMHHQPFRVDPADAGDAAKYCGMDIRGKVMGVIGMGAIGTRVAELAQGLGMKAVAYNRSPREVSGVTRVSLDEVLRLSDVISLNTAMGENLSNCINTRSLSLVKPTAYIINTAREGLIDEKALATALQHGKLAGAGLDMLTDMSKTNPLLGLETVVLTPHIGYLTNESFERMADIITGNVESFAKGRSRNIVTV